MKRAPLLGFVAACGVLASFAFAWSRAARGRGERDPAIAAAPEQQGERASAELQASEGFDPPEPEASVSSAPPTPPTTQRSPALEPPRRIAGRVLFPIPVPAGERVRVRAELHGPPGAAAIPGITASVSDDGSFALDPGEGVERARLRVDSRYFRLYEPIEALPGDASVALRPDAFALVEGVVVPPQSLSTRGAKWSDMAVALWFRSSELALGEDPTLAAKIDGVRKRLVPDHDGRFEVALIPPGVSFTLRVANPFGPEWQSGVEPLAPGELRELRVELELGLAIAGRVIDEDGEPVPGVSVRTDDGEPPPPWSRWPNGETDAAGRFFFPQVPRSVTHVRAGGSEVAHGAEARVDTTRGDVLDLVLSVVRGKAIEGKVSWPDDRSVEGGRVRVRGPIYREDQLAAGSFRVQGLPDGSYGLEVMVEREGVLGTARAQDVSPGAGPVELVLAEEAAFDLSGIVVGEEREVISAFSAYAIGPPPENRSVSATELGGGRFHLRGLEPGEWQLAVQANGYLPAEEWVVAGPTSAEVSIELRRAGRIRGIVLDPARKPVDGAWVGDASAAFAVQFFGPQENVTRADGTFAIKVDESRLQLMAMAKGFAPSETVEVQSTPEGVDGLVLELRSECRVEGRVLAEDGTPVAHARIDALVLHDPRIEADASGRFHVESLPPGRIDFVATHPSGDQRGVGSASVVLVPGQAAAVDIRFRSADPVRLAIQLTRGGRPFSGELGLRSLSHHHISSAGEGGIHELTLAHPGAWSGLVWPAGAPPDWREPARSEVWRFEVVVPDVEAQRFALELDGLPRVTALDDLPEVLAR